MERRNDPRFPIHWPIVFSGALVAGEGTVTNLSMRGCAVENHMPVPSGTELELCALIPDHDCPWTPEKAVVRWSFLRKFGLEFTRIRPEEQARLRRFLSTLAHAGRSTGTEMILVVEDDPTVRTYVREVLTVSGYQVLEAAHGQEALRLCSSHTGAIHLLLTDVVMPGFNGRRLGELVTEARPQTYVLFMSGYPKDATIRRGTQDGSTTLLQKPFSPDVLLRAVREALTA